MMRDRGMDGSVGGMGGIEGGRERWMDDEWIGIEKGIEG